jgi:hypothetical protein
VPQPTIAGEIKRYLRTGDADIDARAWLGDFFERGKRQDADLRGALIREVRRLAKGHSHVTVPANVGVEFTRAKVEPMVRGLFARAEQDIVLATFGKSVVYVTSETIEPILLNHMWDRSAWDLANMYLLSVGAKLLGKRAARIVGMSEETTCYVSPDYFVEDDPFADFIVHEAAHIFHNCKRRTIGLHETRRKEWLLDIEFTKRETFAYSCEAYARIVARAESRGASSHGGRVWIEEAHLRGSRRPGGGREHRHRGRERAEWMEGDPRAMRADRETTVDRPARARAERAACRHRAQLIA